MAFITQLVKKLLIIISRPARLLECLVSPPGPHHPQGTQAFGPCDSPPASPPHPILHHPNCPIRQSPSGHPDNALANPCARPMGRQDCCCHGDGRVAGAAPWQRRIPGTTETKAGGAGGGHTRVLSPVTVGARRHTRAHPCGLASVCVCRCRHSDRRVHMRLGSNVHTCPDAHACPGVCTHELTHALTRVQIHVRQHMPPLSAGAPHCAGARPCVHMCDDACPPMHTCAGACWCRSSTRPSSTSCWQRRRARPARGC